MTVVAPLPIAPGAVANAYGTRKAAILLIQLGQERAASVLRFMSDNEVELLTSEISKLNAITTPESDQVLGEFHELMVARGHIAQGGFGFAQSLLKQSMGEERATEILERLHAADPAQLRSFIAEEHDQVIALVLAHMTPDKASLLLSGLPAVQQARVAHRIAVMDRTSPEIIRSVEAVLERKLSSMLQPAEISRVGGVDPLVNIINRSDRPTERQIVEGLEGLDPVLADEVKSRMFMFEDIVTLDDRSVQQVLRQVETGELALALKGVSAAVKEKITSNLSERAATNLLEEVELLGAVRLAQVEEAQQGVIRTIRQLEEQGQITVRRGNDDEFVI